MPIKDDLVVDLGESMNIQLERTPDLNSRITLNRVAGVIQITDNDGVYIV